MLFKHNIKLQIIQTNLLIILIFILKLSLNVFTNIIFIIQGI